MVATQEVALRRAPGFWPTVLLYDFLLIVLTTLATFFFDFFAGTATLGFGVQPHGEVRGTGMFYLYMSGYFTALIVVLPMLRLGRFWTATAIYLPFVILGFPIGYYFEWVRERTWAAWWSGFGWTFGFLAVGLCADVTFLFLTRCSDRIRAVVTGIVIGLASFLASLACLRLVYRAPHPTGPGFFQGLAYFGLPWLLANSAFGGYTAYAIWRKV